MINQFSDSSEKYNFQCNSTSLTNNSSANTVTALEKNFDLINNHGAFCACVECKPIGNDHENFLSDMPEDPVEIISDPSKIKKKLNWEAKLGFEDLILRCINKGNF